MKKYKDYVENYIYEKDCDGKIMNQAGRIEVSKDGIGLTMDLLLRLDPRVVLIFWLNCPTNIAHRVRREVYEAMSEAFHQYIDFHEGGLTAEGRAKFWDSSHWLQACADSHRNTIQFNKIKDDPAKVEAWPVKGYVIDLGGKPTSKPEVL